MLEGHAFIAEIAPDLIDPFQPADQQPFEIQLKRDPQEKVLMELVVMGDEGPGGRAAIDGLENGGFHFDEIMIIQNWRRARTVAARILKISCTSGLTARST